MLGFGLLMVLSSSSVAAFRNGGSSFSVFANQATYAAVGLVCFCAAQYLPVRLMRSLSTIAVIISLALLVAVLVPGIGALVNGARSWIRIGGFQFQPSEIAKLALLLWMAHVLAARRSTLGSPKALLIPVLPVFVLMAGLIMLQPDLGTTVALTIVFMAVLFFAGAPWWMFASLGAAGVAGFFYLAISAEYRLARLLSFINPEAHPDVVLPAAAEPVRDGQRRLVRRRARPVQGEVELPAQRRLRLHLRDHRRGTRADRRRHPAAAVRAAGLHRAADRPAQRRPVRQDRRLGVPPSGWSARPAINIGYVVGLLPVTGIPLPMISAGGTSLLITMVVFGLLANFARREPQAAAALQAGGGSRLARFLGMRHGRPQRPRRRRAAPAARGARPAAGAGASRADRHAAPAGARPARPAPRPDRPRPQPAPPNQRCDQREADRPPAGRPARRRSARRRPTRRGAAPDPPAPAGAARPARAGDPRRRRSATSEPAAARRSARVRPPAIRRPADPGRPRRPAGVAGAAREQCPAGRRRDRRAHRTGARGRRRAASPSTRRSGSPRSAPSADWRPPWSRPAATSCG